MGSVSISSKSFEGRYFKFTVSQSGTSTSVSWKFEVLGGSSLYYTASPITLKINGTTVWSKSSITYWNDYVFPATTGSTSGTHSIGSYGSFTVQLIGNPNWHTAETVSGTVTLDRPTYPVYYNTMGGSGTFNAQTKTYGINLGLHSHKPTKTGYTFQGWATSSGSSTVAYAAGATYTGNARLDLFAVWKADTYAVTYNANGGSGAPANQTKTYGVSLTLQTGVPTRSLYNFLGWGTSASATTVAYAPGATYTGNSALNLYAIWELAYVKPRITNYTVTRTNDAGEPTEDGTWAVVSFNWATDRDVTSVKMEWKLASETSYPSGNSETVDDASGTNGVVNTKIGNGTLSADNTYTFKVTVMDSIDSSDEIRSMSSMEFTLDLLAGGKGAAFGKAAETENLLDVDWNLKVNGDILFTDASGTRQNLLSLGLNPITSTTNDTPANWVKLGTGVGYYNKASQLINQPTTNFFIDSKVYGNTVHQIAYLRGNTPKMWLRSGNASGWSCNWIPMNFNPSASARGNAGQVSLAAAALTKLTLNTWVARNDTTFTFSNGGIYCPYAGTVMVSGSIYYYSSQNICGVYIYKNSSEVHSTLQVGGNGGMTSGSALISVAAGDIIYLYARPWVACSCYDDNTATSLMVTYV